MNTQIAQLHFRIVLFTLFGLVAVVQSGWAQGEGAGEGEGLDIEGTTEAEAPGEGEGAVGEGMTEGEGTDEGEGMAEGEGVADTAIPIELLCPPPITVEVDENCQGIVPNLTSRVVMTGADLGDFTVSQSPEADTTMRIPRNVTLTAVSTLDPDIVRTCQIRLIGEGCEPVGTLVGKVGSSMGGLLLACSALVVRAAGAYYPTTSMPNGQYMIELPAGHHVLRGFAPGYRRLEIPIYVAENQENPCDFTLIQSNAARTLRGKVTDAVTGEPLPAVEVKVYQDGELLAYTYSCFHGDYELVFEAKGSSDVFQVTYVRPNFEPEEVEVEIAPGDTEIEEVELQRKVGTLTTIQGVVRSESGTPVAGAVVRAGKYVTSMDELTTSEGAFEVTAEDEGRGTTLHVTARGYQDFMSNVAIDPDDSKPIDFDVTLLPVVPASSAEGEGEGDTPQPPSPPVCGGCEETKVSQPGPELVVVALALIAAAKWGRYQG